MKKLIFALLGVTIAVLMYVTFLAKIPIFYFTGNNVAGLVGDSTGENQEYQEIRPEELGIETLEHYSIDSVAIYDDKLNGGIVFGKLDPMKFTVIKPTPEPDPGEGGTEPGNNTPLPTNPPIDYALELEIIERFRESGVLPVDVEYFGISSYFGYRTDPFTKKIAFHKGIDIAATNTNVKDTIYLKPAYAVLDGEVVFAQYNGNAGNEIIIDHGNFQTVYMHLDSISVVKGEQVTAGQEIGKIGQTGRATGPHLHFEVRINNQSVDPLKFLPLDLMIE